jgi:hypothetical protein
MKNKLRISLENYPISFEKLKQEWNKVPGLLTDSLFTDNLTTENTLTHNLPTDKINFRDFSISLQKYCSFPQQTMN